MTREEAITTLKEMHDSFDRIHENSDGEIGYEQMTALDVAIEALQNEETLKTQLANCHKEILRLLDFNDITESPNDVVKTKDDVIKKPRTVRYKLHKPIEYVSIEVDEEEEITHIGHYTAYGERREP